MGSIWLAEHERLKSRVVVKFIVGEYARHDEALARFEREASLAAQAKSPHVVQVYDHGIALNGLPYIAMEHLEGEDLATRIAREGRIEALRFAEWFRQASSGLFRAHSKQIIHRDIKPENVFLCDEDGEVVVKILDFGIAKSQGGSVSDFSGTKTGAFLGTAYYMSPEQTMGSKGLDHRTDLWAMGVLAYYALTGVRPFDGDAIGALVLGITSHEPVAPSYHVPTLPIGVDAWMHKALAKQPEARFQSAREMASALAEAMTGRALTLTADFGARADPSMAATSQGRPGTTLSPSLSATTDFVDGRRARRAHGRFWMPAGLAAAALTGALLLVWFRTEPSVPAPKAAASPTVVEATPAPEPTVETQTAPPNQDPEPPQLQRPSTRQEGSPAVRPHGDSKATAPARDERPIGSPPLTSTAAGETTAGEATARPATQIGKPPPRPSPLQMEIE